MFDKIILSVNNYKENNPQIYEFIMFNLLSNIATITNFLTLWICKSFIFQKFAEIDFNWFIFTYAAKDGGLASFLSFLVAFTLSQIVNFFVQRHLVFDSNVDIKSVIGWYIATVVVAGIVSMWLPPYVMSWTQPFLGNFSMFFANVVNIVVQVLINYPMMKFKIMKSVEK